MNLRLGLLTKITYRPEVVWFCLHAKVATTLPAWLPQWCSTNPGDVHLIPARDNYVFIFRWGVCRQSSYTMCCGNSLLYSFSTRLKLLLDSFECLSDAILSDLIICRAENFLLHYSFLSVLNCAYCKVSRLINHMQVSWSIKISTTMKPLTSLLGFFSLVGYCSLMCI